MRGVGRLLVMVQEGGGKGRAGTRPLPRRAHRGRHYPGKATEFHRDSGQLEQRCGNLLCFHAICRHTCTSGHGRVLLHGSCSDWNRQPAAGNTQLLALLRTQPIRTYHVPLAAQSALVSCAYVTLVRCGSDVAPVLLRGEMLRDSSQQLPTAAA